MLMHTWAYLCIKLTENSSRYKIKQRMKGGENNAINLEKRFI